MSEANRAIVRRIHDEAESKGNLAVIEEVYGPEFGDARHPERGLGPQEVKQHIERLRAAFPDLRVTLDDLIAIVIRRLAGGKVVEQWSQYDSAGLVRQLHDAGGHA